MIEKIAFGRTGHDSTRLLFGAAAFFTATQAEADATMEVVLEHGINHIDTAASYGEAETVLGPWMRRHRDRFFLATKTGHRTYQEALDEIQRSLERLQTEQVDLIQLHAVIEDDEWQTALGPGGALEGALEARRQGLVRFIGITSHSLKAPDIHLKSLERFDFDSVLLPWNYMLAQNPQYAGSFHALREQCREKNVAFQMIKTLQRRPWGDRTPTRNTWYEPLEEDGAIEGALRWALAHEGTFINTAGDMGLLPKILEIAGMIHEDIKETIPGDAAMERVVREYGMESLW